MKSKLIKMCPVCSTEYQTAAKTCSRKCSGIYHSGSNNPNYGKSWTEEQRNRQSEIVKSKVDDVYRQKAGSANRGINFSRERIESMHGHRDSSSYSRKHSDDVKKVIGEKSREKFTEDYKQKQRQKFIELGYWVSDEDKDDYEIYVEHSAWIKPMWDLADCALLETVGIFNSKNNRNGLVRDHMLSRKYGFDNGIFPEIIRHPANCQIITHSENSSKREKSCLTFIELCDKIEKYKEPWEEHELVLSLINKWRNGERFSAKDYRRKSNAISIFSI
jgi:hypothetical protein